MRRIWLLMVSAAACNPATTPDGSTPDGSGLLPDGSSPCDGAPYPGTEGSIAQAIPGSIQQPGGGGARVFPGQNATCFLGATLSDLWCYTGSYSTSSPNDFRFTASLRQPFWSFASDAMLTQPADFTLVGYSSPMGGGDGGPFPGGLTLTLGANANIDGTICTGDSPIRWNHVPMIAPLPCPAEVTPIPGEGVVAYGSTVERGTTWTQSDNRDSSSRASMIQFASTLPGARFATITMNLSPAWARQTAGDTHSQGESGLLLQATLSGGGMPDNGSRIIRGTFTLRASASSPSNDVVLDGSFCAESIPPGIPFRIAFNSMVVH